MSSDNKKLGQLGEELAAKYLSDRGIWIIDKNYYTRWGELDLIAQEGDEILFCEVKTRTSTAYGFPEMAVDEKKVSHLLKAINIYLNHKRLDNYWRLDIIAIILDKKTKIAKIKHFKNITL